MNEAIKPLDEYLGGNKQTQGTLTPGTVEDGYRFKPYLGHRPIKEEGVWLGHGHVHHLWKVKEQMINVSYDIWKRPVHLHRDIRSIIDKVDNEG